MSTTIDQKVVEMRLDNKHFESNAQTSIETTERLKKSLNMDGVAKGFEGIDSAVKKVDMGPLGNAVQTVGLKFNALYSVADQALRNITNSAMAAGKRIVSALTIDPIKTGFSEYETQINAVQTILANTESKGKTLTDVNKALDELNTYADKTIYNFTEMTRNIGTFTAAGVDLDTSVSAIKGIANLAAVSGSTSQQASTAMYQLSQALASGTVKLMDWNSVVNAGMGGQVFQDALKETARVHGIAIDDLIAKEGSFRETLQDGWLTSEILTETLAKFTGDLTKEQLKSMGYTDEQIKSIIKMGETANNAATKVKTFTQLFDTLKEAAQSGWTQTWEIIVGDFEEAKELLTKVSDTIGKMIGSSADARNELLENWKVMGGRADLIESVKNAFEGIMSIIKPIKEAFSEMFPPLTAEQLVAFTKGLKELTAKFKLSDSASEKLKRTFRGLFAVVDIVRQMFVAIFKAVGSLSGNFIDLGGGILNVTASFGDWLVSLNEFVKSGNVFNKIFQGVADVIKTIYSFVKKKFVLPGWKILCTFLNQIHDSLFSIGDAADRMSFGLSEVFAKIRAAFTSSSLYKLIASLWDGFYDITKGLVEGLGTILGTFFKKLGNGDFQGFFDMITSLISGGLGVALIQFIHKLTTPLQGFGDVMDGVADCIGAFEKKIKAEALQKTAIAIGILAASLLTLSLIDREKLAGAIAAITILFTEMTIVMKVLDNMDTNFKGVGKACLSMIAMSTAIFILASALKKIGDLEFDELVGGLIGITGLAAIVVAVAKILGSGSEAIIKGATQMIIFATAIKILASVCADLAVLTWEEMAKGLIGVGTLMAAVAVFLKTAKFSSKTITTAAGIVILAGAIKILASACDDFGSMDWVDIGKGLSAIAGLLAEITIFTKLMGDAKHIISIGLALVAIAGAADILANVVQTLGSLSWEEIARGLVGLAGALTIITVALRLMPKNIVSLSSGLLILASSLVVLAKALISMGSMSWSEIAKGITALSASLAILAISLHAMKSTLAGSAALTVAASALAALIPTFVILGSLSWSAIIKSLTAVTASIAILALTAALLTESGIVAGMLLVAGSLALIGAAAALAGVGLVLMGVGLSGIATGLTALILAISGGATALVAAVGAIVVGLLDLLPVIVNAVSDLLVALCELIIDFAPALCAAIAVLVVALVDMLIECIPILLGAFVRLLIEWGKLLVELTPQYIETVFNWLISIIDGLAAHIPELIQSFMNLLTVIFNGVIDALSNMDPHLIENSVKSVGLLAAMLGIFGYISQLIPGAMIGVLGMGLVVAEFALVISALGAMSRAPGLEWLITEGGNFLQKIGTALGQFVGGFAGGMAQGIISSLPKMANDLSSFMTNLTPFIEGASSINSSVVDGVKSLVAVVLAITGADIINGLTSWFTGGSSVTKFAEELPVLGKGLKGFSDSVAGISAENIISASKAAKALAEMTATIPNEGGVVGWFSGENSIAKFGSELPTLGQGLKGFSDSVAGISHENIIAAVESAKTLAEMTSTIPNSGGVAAWFYGDNSVARFAIEIGELGTGLALFSSRVAGIVPENIVAAANAAKALAEMTATIPNEGGMSAWFSGTMSMSSFTDELIILAAGLKGFSVGITGVNIESVAAGAKAAKALAEMTATIPNEGGVVGWFSGESSITKFANQLPTLGKGLKGFSDSVVGIVSESVMAGVNSAKALAEMTAIIPKEGGVKAWFVGDSSVSNFANQLPTLGKGLKGFSDSVTGISPQNITSAASAAKALAEMTAVIPTEGGVKAWFTGETSISNFASKLPSLGKGLKGFSDSVKGISAQNITSASNAAKSLGEMSNSIPKNTDSLVKFGSNIDKFGNKLSAYFKDVSGISGESISTSTKALDAIKKTSEFDSGKISSTSKSINDLAKSIKNLANVPKNATSEFTKALKTLGEKCVDNFIDPFENADDDMKKAGKKAIEAFIDGVKSASSKAEKACTSIVDDCASAIKNKSNSFNSAGKYLVSGFANGINENAYKATAKARAMAKAAAEAARKALDINSPSKVFKKIGASIPEGFAMGIDKFSSMVKTSSVSMATSAIDNVNKSISRIADVINSDVDAQPTIRPVLDLSDIKSGAGNISSILGSSSVGVSANVGAISSMMNRRNQNGGNDDVVSAIDKLDKHLDNVGGTSYNIGGITYDDGSNVAELVKALIQAAKVERRV